MKLCFWRVSAVALAATLLIAVKVSGQTPDPPPIVPDPPPIAASVQPRPDAIPGYRPVRFDPASGWVYEREVSRPAARTFPRDLGERASHACPTCGAHAGEIVGYRWLNGERQHIHTHCGWVWSH